MSCNFDRAFLIILKHEGNYVNHPSDPGGETNYGISKRAYPDLDIKNMTIEQAKEIYKKDYWDRAGCEKFDWPLCLVHFDTAVQHGVARALDMQKKASGAVDYIFLRLAYYSQINNPAFMRGWINRMVELYRTIRPSMIIA